jgi:hypothetical protein
MNHQARLMHTMYTQAYKVLIWLVERYLGKHSRYDYEENSDPEDGIDTWPQSEE